MEQYLLKSKLQVAIDGEKVVAAVFFTFNFEPAFFENYVLPIVVPSSYQFTESSIANQVLWKECAKNGDMPPVTVYCDNFAKDNIEAPALGYDIRCIKLPEAKGTLCNFHPKHIFLLLGNNDLIVVTGSGNLTAGGWCRNIEAFHIDRFRKPSGQRPFGQKNGFQILFERLAAMMKKGLSDAELLISERSLRYFPPTPWPPSTHKWEYFSSLDEGFDEFLEMYVLEEDVREVEIISPYFSHDESLLLFLKQRGVEKLRFLLPAFGDEIFMEKKTYDLFCNNGVTWHKWASSEMQGRFNHSKVYRFYGAKDTYTIIGSVNFTRPAWASFEPKDNRANLESAILYIGPPNVRLLDSKEVSTEGYRFIPKNTAENAQEWQQVFAERNAPELYFTIDWQAKNILVEYPELTVLDLHFKSILDGQAIRKKKEKFRLDPKSLRLLSRNSLIEILETRSGGKETTHFYYPTHLHFEQKPLSFRLSATNILQFWNKLDADDKGATQARLLADFTDEDTGELSSNAYLNVSLMNEWALHFNGLVKLERFLFESKRLARERQDQAKKVEWYLLHHSYETLPFYLQEMKQQYEDGKLHKSFYWMILQIVSQNFYKRKDAIASNLDAKTKSAFRGIAKGLLAESDEVLQKVNLDAVEMEKWKWLEKQINKTI